MSEENGEKGRGCCCFWPWPATKEKGRGFLELEMKRRRECYQMRIFSSFLLFIYLISIN